MRGRKDATTRGATTTKNLATTTTAIAVSDAGRVPAKHVLIAQYETKADILSDLERHKDAAAARREARKMRDSLPPPHLRHKRR